MPRSRKSSRTGRSKKSDRERNSDDIETEVERNGTDLELGISRKGMGASISTNGILKLGIGVAAVELDLKDPNNSKISYAWELFEIEGEREGCTVTLTYYIQGIEAKTETRTIPECEDEEAGEGQEDDQDQNEEEEGWTDEDEKGGWNPGEQNQQLPYGNPYDKGIWWVMKVSNESLYLFEPSNRHYSSVSIWSATNIGGVDGWGEQAFTVRRDFYKRTAYFPPDYRAEESPNPVVAEGQSFYEALLTGNFREPGNDRIVTLLSNWGQHNSGYYLGGRRFFAYNWIKWSLRKDLVSQSGGKETYRSLYSDPSRNTSQEEESEDTGKVLRVRNVEKLIVVAEYITEKAPGNADQSIPPIRRKMQKECCQMIAALYEVMAVEELQSNGLETPNRWIAAGGKKHSKHKTYLDLIVFQMKMQDHLGIHPFRAEVTDVNASLEGDQSNAVEFANATAAAKQIVELLLENKGDSATRLNLMMRTAIAAGQILNVVSIIAKTFEGVVQYLGMPIRERVVNVKMPFDFSFGQRKRSKSGQGFGKGTQSGVDELDINTEEATEALLPKFMADAEQPIRYEDFDDRENDLTDIIKKR